MKTWFPFFLAISINAKAQNINFHLTGDYNIYSRYVNPHGINDTVASSAGQLFGILPSLGIATFFGSDKFAFSIDSKANIKLYTIHYNIKKFKGISSIDFPVIGKLNYGFYMKKHDIEGHFHIGIGQQWNKTELFFNRKNFHRNYYSTYVVEIALGIGNAKYSNSFFIRYGFGQNNSGSFNCGINYNVGSTKKYKAIQTN